MSRKKTVREDQTPNKEKGQGKRGPQNKPVSLSHLTFDEAIDIALSTKPKKKSEEDKDGGEDKQHEAPKIQILTVAELLDGAEIKYPRMLVSTFKRAKRRHKDPGPKQDSFL